MSHLFVTGKGIHTNKICVVEIQESSERKPLSLCFCSIQNKLQTQGWSSFIEQPIYATRLISGLGSLQTPEHLMAVLLGFSHLSLKVYCRGGEPPIGDGSGSIFFDAISDKWGENPKFYQYNTNIKGSIECSKGVFEYEPHSCFKVDYTFSQGDIEERFVFDLADSNAIDIYKDEIIPSRTFIFWDEYQKIKRQNLLLGASLENGVLYTRNQEDYLQASKFLEIPKQIYPKIEYKKKDIDMECSKHKILDLLGDLALFRLQLPNLSFRIVNGGHWQNHFLIKELIHEYNRTRL